MVIKLMVMIAIVELTRYLTDWWTSADVNAQTFRGKNRSPLRAKPPNQLLPLSIVILAYEEAEPVWLAQIEKYSLFNESIIVGTFAIIGNIIVVVICTEGAPRSRLFDDQCYIHLRWSCLQTHHHHHHIFKHFHRSFFHGPSSGNFPSGIHLSCCI